MEKKETNRDKLQQIYNEFKLTNPSSSQNVIEAKTIKEFQKIVSQEKNSKIEEKAQDPKEIARNREIQRIKSSTLK
eukprot:CAMPEP_0116919890 /NCGR_PEP_ID=MMETSP0467-20121206/20674_1 /TAXON_ID=283647 /ORGANISM="Mesodinium pulex, Strain SPMC105" /LENGTH=75 /DNA_ID=CAMNT_0004597593 /DNA_START=572 /DNA_END=799 /DNA_ORIENTATION=-